MNHEPTTTPSILRFRQNGDLTSTNSERLSKDLKSAVDSAHLQNATVVLDLTSAKMVDSVGLNLIVTALRAIQNFGGKMCIEYSNQNVYRTFVFTRLDKHVELVKIG